MAKTRANRECNLIESLPEDGKINREISGKMKWKSFGNYMVYCNESMFVKGSENDCNNMLLPIGSERWVHHEKHIPWNLLIFQ